MRVLSSAPRSALRAAPSLARGARRAPPRRAAVVVRAKAAEEVYTPSSAKEAIEKGTSIFDGKGSTEEALRLLKAGLELNPNEDEARAAEYNLACVYTSLGRYEEAAACVSRAVNDHNLRLVVALRDKDLAKLRETQPWLAALKNMKGSISEEAKIKMRAEAKSPFRLARTYIFGGFLAAAALSTFITIPALILAFQGKEGTDLTTVAGNFAINLGGLALFPYLLKRDADAQARQVKVIAREEGLGELPVKIGKSGKKTVPMAALRGVCRPVVLVGNQTYLDRCMRAVEPFYADMRARGVSVIPILNTSAKAADPSDRIVALRKEFEADAASSAADGFGAKAPKKDTATTKSSKVGASDAKWRLEADNTADWMEWVFAAKEAAGVEADTVYIQVQMDGSIRASGTGIPPWAQFVGDIPELDSIRTKVTDGIGPSL